MCQVLLLLGAWCLELVLHNPAGLGESYTLHLQMVQLPLSAKPRTLDQERRILCPPPAAVVGFS